MILALSFYIVLGKSAASYKNMCQITSETLKEEAKKLHAELLYQNVQEFEMSQSYNINKKTLFVLSQLVIL